MRVPLPISWHVQDWTDNRVGTYVQRVLPFFLSTGRPFWIKGIDPPEQKPDWVVPGVKILGRMFEPDAETWADMARGRDGALPFYNRFIAKWQARPWVDVWTMGNEPHPPSDPNFLAQLREFLIELSLTSFDRAEFLVRFGDQGVRIERGGRTVTWSWRPIMNFALSGRGV